MKYFSNLLWAILFTSSNRPLIAHLVKHKSWYIGVNWHPGRFVDSQAELEQQKEQVESYREREIQFYKDSRDSEVRYEELNSKYELEVTKLKDLIQAKDLVIKRMGEQLQKEKSDGL